MLVKKDFEKYFLDGEPTKTYYTGRTGTFPSTIALNKFYYFMPYFKGRGVRDIYLIRIARIGTKAEVRPTSEDHEPRILFDLEYVGRLPDYQDIKLAKYFFRDTVLGRILEKTNNEHT